MNTLVREYDAAVNNIRRVNQNLLNASNNAAFERVVQRISVVSQRYLNASRNLLGALGNLSWNNKRLVHQLPTSQWPPGRARNELNRRRTTFRKRIRREISGKK